jgi:hypothetical protein
MKKAQRRSCGDFIHGLELSLTDRIASPVGTSAGTRYCAQPPSQLVGSIRFNRYLLMISIRNVAAARRLTRIYRIAMQKIAPFQKASAASAKCDRHGFGAQEPVVLYGSGRRDVRFDDEVCWVCLCVFVDSHQAASPLIPTSITCVPVLVAPGSAAQALVAAIYWHIG